MDPEPESLTLSSLNDLDRTIHAPARLMIMTYLYTVESADYIFLQNLTDLTWGNLASHLKVLEEDGYLSIEKEFVGKKPHSMVQLTAKGREAFRKYRQSMQQVLGDLPE